MKPNTSIQTIAFFQRTDLLANLHNAWKIMWKFVPENLSFVEDTLTESILCVILAIPSSSMLDVSSVAQDSDEVVEEMDI